MDIRDWIEGIDACLLRKSVEVERRRDLVIMVEWDIDQCDACRLLKIYNQQQ